MIEIILFLVLIIIIYYIRFSQDNYYLFDKTEPFKNNDNHDKCNLDIDKLYIYDRDKDYNKYVNKIIDNNNNINYSDEEIKIMKNKHQFYNLQNNNNISNLVLGECKNSYGCGYGCNYDGDAVDTVDAVGTYDIGGGSYYGYNSNVSGGFNSDINETMGVGDVKGSKLEKGGNENSGAFGSCDSNLANYYYDLEGNNIISTLQTYKDNYNDDNECVNVKYGTNSKSSMIIPNTYNINKDLTNAYDVDWQNVLNPLTIY